eukprot:1345272-Amorphochlora_amoeboformis.AAC.1
MAEDTKTFADEVWATIDPEGAGSLHVDLAVAGLKALNPHVSEHELRELRSIAGAGSEPFEYDRFDLFSPSAT